MYVNHGEENTILCSQNRLSGLHQALLDGKQTCVCQETNIYRAMLFGFSYEMASASVRRSRLDKAVVQRQLHECI